MDSFSLTTKGQVVIPVSLRKKYGLRPGTRVFFYDDGDEIRLVPVTPESVDAQAGFLKGKKSLLRALSAEKKRERAR